MDDLDQPPTSPLPPAALMIKPKDYKCAENDALRLWVVEYEDQRGRQWRTAVDAYTLEAARRQFRRDNPDVELLTCY